MADPILVHIFFSGLIAFAPTPVGGSSVEELTVLLPDAHAYVKGTMANNACADKHWAKIRFWQPEPAACTAQGCTPGDGACECALNHDMIAIGPVALGMPHKDLKKRPDIAVPAPASASDFAYVVNMETLNHTRLHPVFLSDLPPGGFPPGLAAKMRIPFQALQACAFAKVDKVHQQFDFKRRQTTERPVHGQALAVSIMSVTSVRNDGERLVTLTLTSADGTLRFFKLRPASCGDENCAEILVMNERHTLPDGDHCLDGGIGWDFDFFFDLAAGKPVRRLPHASSGNSTEIPNLCTTKLFPALMADTTNSRPVCPMATFFQ